MNELKVINKDILKKIDELDEGQNKKDFLKKALVEEYNHRDKEFYHLKGKKNPKYGDFVDEYYDK